MSALDPILLAEELAEAKAETVKLRAALLSIDRAIDDHFARANNPWVVMDRAQVIAREALR